MRCRPLHVAQPSGRNPNDRQAQVPRPESAGGLRALASTPSRVLPQQLHLHGEDTRVWHTLVHSRLCAHVVAVIKQHHTAPALSVFD